MVMDGRYLVEEYDGEMMGQPFKGMGLMAYDNSEQRFVSAWIDNMGTGIMTISPGAIAPEHRGRNRQ